MFWLRMVKQVYSLVHYTHTVLCQKKHQVGVTAFLSTGCISANHGMRQAYEKLCVCLIDVAEDTMT